MIQTPLCDLLEIEFPLVQAPIGPAAGPELAAAVADAGGLGMLSVTWNDPDRTREWIRTALDSTDGTVGVNLVLDEATSVLDPETHVDICLEAGADVFSFAWGECAPFVERIRANDGFVLQTIGSAAAAQTAVASGADVVVAQGVEAGGHVQSEVATMPLVAQVTEAVDVPVVSAGGISDGRGIAAVLALGAAGAWLGTRFLVAEEARIHDAYRTAITGAAETDTVLSTLFDQGWPDAMHRVLKNDTTQAWEDAGRPSPGRRPGEGETVVTLPDGTELPRYSTALPLPGMEGAVEQLPLYAGQSVGGAETVQPAGQVVDDLRSETEAAIRRLGKLR